MERWHLWHLHSQPQVNWLSARIREDAEYRLREAVKVTVESSWVDCRPVAWFDLWTEKGLMSQHCELGDLLLLTDLDVRGAKASNSVLLQAKCTDSVSSLDLDSNAFPGNQSTHAQRNLYEAHRGPVEVKASGGSGAKVVGGPYHLWPPGWPFTGYLLVPRRETQDKRTLPYQVLWPDGRQRETGVTCHLLDLLRGMLLFDDVPWGYYGPVYPPLQATREALVRDVRKHLSEKDIKRFSSVKRRTLKSGSVAAALAGFSAISASFPWDQWLPALSKLYAVPPLKPNKLEGEGDAPRGMLVLRVSVRSSPDGELREGRLARP